MRIQDGAGTGHSAEVTSDNKLKTNATGHTEEHTASTDDGRAFFANSADTADTLSLATGNTYNLLYIKNTSSTREMVIQKIDISSDTADVVLTIKKNMTISSLDDQNTHVPVNTNFSSGHAAEGTFYNWDETGTVGLQTLAGGTILNTLIMAVGPDIIPVDGAYILGQGNTLVLEMTNGTGGTAEVTCGVRFYYNLLGT